MWQIALAAAAMSAYDGQKGKEAAETAASSSAKSYYLTAREELRRLKTSQELNSANIQAGSAASGLMNTGSNNTYRNAVDAEQTKQYRWEAEAINMNARAIRRGGQLQGQALQRAGNARALQSGIGAFSSYWNQKQGVEGGA